jgi:hypothetical protein
MGDFIKRYSLMLLVLAALVAIPTAWAADVCRAYSFEGMSENKKRAELFLPETTSSQDKTNIYIEYTPDGEIYYHSNYVTPGHEYPTKVRGNPETNDVFADLQRVFLNILYDEKPSDSDASKVRKLLREHVKVHVDVSIFDANGIPRIDLSEVKNVSIVDGHKGVDLASGGEVLTTQKPPPSLIAKIKGCCFFGRPPHRVNEYGEALKKRAFNPSEVQIASLFIDSATEAVLTKNKALKSARLAGDGKALRSISDLEKLFASARSKTLILLGHVEGSDYVIRDAANKEQFRTSIESIRNLAKQESVSLVDIGCETTKAIQSASLGVGISTKYNSVEAVKAISRAMKTSKNFAEFMEGISSKGLKIVVDESFVTDQVNTIRTTVYSRLKGAVKAKWIQVARVTLSLIVK